MHRKHLGWRSLRPTAGKPFLREGVSQAWRGSGRAGIREEMSKGLDVSEVDVKACAEGVKYIGLFLCRQTQSREKVSKTERERKRDRKRKPTANVFQVYKIKRQDHCPLECARKHILAASQDPMLTSNSPLSLLAGILLTRHATNQGGVSLMGEEAPFCPR